MKKQLTALMSTLMLTTATLGVVSCMSNNAVAMEHAEVEQLRVAHKKIVNPNDPVGLAKYNIKETNPSNTVTAFWRMDAQHNGIGYINGTKHQGFFTQSHKDFLNLANQYIAIPGVLDEMHAYQGTLKAWHDLLKEDKQTTYPGLLNNAIGEVGKLIERIRHMNPLEERMGMRREENQRDPFFETVISSFTQHPTVIFMAQLGSTNLFRGPEEQERAVLSITQTFFDQIKIANNGLIGEETLRHILGNEQYSHSVLLQNSFGEFANPDSFHNIYGAFNLYLGGQKLKTAREFDEDIGVKAARPPEINWNALQELIVISKDGVNPIEREEIRENEMMRPRKKREQLMNERYESLERKTRGKFDRDAAQILLREEGLDGRPGDTFRLARWGGDKSNQEADRGINENFRMYLTSQLILERTNGVNPSIEALNWVNRIFSNEESYQDRGFFGSVLEHARTFFAVFYPESNLTEADNDSLKIFVNKALEEFSTIEFSPDFLPKFEEVNEREMMRRIPEEENVDPEVRRRREEHLIGQTGYARFNSMYILKNPGTRVEERGGYSMSYGFPRVDKGDYYGEISYNEFIGTVYNYLGSTAAPETVQEIMRGGNEFRFNELLNPAYDFMKKYFKRSSGHALGPEDYNNLREALMGYLEDQGWEAENMRVSLRR